MSEEFWGSEAREFKAERFVARPQDGTGLKMRPFGGGPTLCPGRYVSIDFYFASFSKRETHGTLFFLLAGTLQQRKSRASSQALSCDSTLNSLKACQRWTSRLLAWALCALSVSACPRSHHDLNGSSSALLSAAPKRRSSAETRFGSASAHHHSPPQSHPYTPTKVWSLSLLMYILLP